MGGLIPLMLKPAAGGSRTSVIFPQTLALSSTAAPVTSTAQREQPLQPLQPLPLRIRKASPSPSRQPHSRDTSPAPSSVPSLSQSPSPPPLASRFRAHSLSPVPSSPTEIDHQVSQSPRQMAARRLSQQPPLALPVLPYTNAEWAKAIAEVKRQYLNRRYRPCSVRCGEILDNIKDPSAVEPTYLIYLHFYAASSLEMSARALQLSSPYRTRLLQQARDHYRSAEQLIRTADESITRSSRPSSVATTSTLHSPAGSISSRAWTNSTELTSPNLSIYSLEDITARSNRSSRSSQAVKQSPSKIVAPAPASKKRVTFSLSEEPIIRPDSPTLGFDDFSLYARPTSPQSLREESDPEPEHQRVHEPVAAASSLAEVVEVDRFDVADRSVHRYCGLLASLRTELTSHLAEVEAQLAAPPAARSGRATPEFGLVREADDEMRSLELKTRIERLRQNGWQRKRFNPRRYEELRETVLSELEE